MLLPAAGTPGFALQALLCGPAARPEPLQFDVSVIHPRWFTLGTARSLVSPTAEKTCSPPVDTERLKTVQYMTMETIKDRIEQLSGDVRGLKSKGEYVQRLLDLEASPPPQAPGATAAEAVDG